MRSTLGSVHLAVEREEGQLVLSVRDHDRSGFVLALPLGAASAALATLTAALHSEVDFAADCVLGGALTISGPSRPAGDSKA